MDMKQLLKDKRVWAGAAVVAAIAVVAVVRNRGAGGGEAGTGASTAAGPAGYYQAATGNDTTGANLASFLGNWGQANLDAQQQGFKSILDALNPTTSPATTTAQFAGGQGVQAWLNEINAANPGLNLTTAKFRELNPTVDIRQANLYGFVSANNPAGPNRGPVNDVFHSPSGTVRIR